MRCRDEGKSDERAGSTLYSYMNDRVKMDQVAEETSYDKRCTDRFVGWMCTRVHTRTARASSSARTTSGRVLCS